MNIRKALRQIIHNLPTVRDSVQGLEKELEIYRVNYPPGHYYSPTISVREVSERATEIFSIRSNKIEGIDLQEEKQLELLDRLKEMYPSIPFAGAAQPGLRYYYNNQYYLYSDAIFLHLLMRHYKPRRIIEVGSGFSSAVMMDTNDLFLDKSLTITFIEPYPDRLFSLIRPGDRSQYVVIENNLQRVDRTIFSALKENDILFVDSTHVTKTGSDVNMLLFEILPSLAKGVLIHFHDIFYPFEYPREWVLSWCRG